MNYSVGTDIGGTFTDCVVIEENGAITTGKSPSTPPDFSVGFFNAVSDAAGKLGLSLSELLSSSQVLVHATTAGTNAVVERQGVRVGLLTTRGHEEAMLIMRGGGRTKGLDVDDYLYIPGTYKPDPIVPRSLIRGVHERIDSKGAILVELDEDGVRTALRELLDAGAEAIAISFLWSFANEDHERRAQEIVREMAPELFVACGHEVSRQMGEYYRTVATVMNSYIGPLMNSYSGRIVDGAVREGYSGSVFFAQCLGGVGGHEAIRRAPLFTLDSGPVSGIVACTHLGEEFGYSNIISADMGGTTLDVSVIPGGEPQRRESTVVNKYAMYLPIVDVESIGAGGGSIAWLDPASETIKVGPRSAGADPGPLCYKQGGTEPTVTDADVVLGIVNPENFLGGRRPLDRAAAVAGIEALGVQVGLSAEEAAAGIQEIIDNVMAEKIRRMTIFRGEDPREFVVFAFGGAGPTHAGAFSRELGVEKVVVPLGDTASVLSAMGTVSSDIAHVYDQVSMFRAPFDMDQLWEIFAGLEEQGRAELTAEGFGDAPLTFTPAVAMKYGAQVYDIELTLNRDDTSDSLVARFEEVYEGRYGKGSGYAPAGIEIIRQRSYAAAALQRPALAMRRTGQGRKPAEGRRPVWWREASGWVDTPIWSDLEYASSGMRIEGPAVLDLPATTVPVRPGESIEVDDYGNLMLTFG